MFVPGFIRHCLIPTPCKLLLNITLILISCVLFIQVGTNYANDYFDFKKGADTEDRVGPTRMTQSGAVSPTAMKNATILMFTLALATGLYLAYIGGWPILLIGLMAVFFGVIYTAGPFALAYIGGAEIVSYLFFGPVSVIGTVYLLTGQWNFDLIAVGSGIGLITSALLVVNNTRDIDTDRKVNKKTWAVRFGPTFCLIEYIVFVSAIVFIGLKNHRSSGSDDIAYIFGRRSDVINAPFW